MNKTYRTRAFIGLSLIALLGVFGCTTVPETPATATTESTPPPPPPPAKRAGELALAEGVDLYNQGNYAAAIKKLQESSEIWTETTPIRVEALKYMAFASCVTNQRARCRQNFDRLLELDATFDLAPAEAEHPYWTPVFKQAKQAATNAPRRPATRP
jgi:hypothetical protein